MPAGRRWTGFTLIELLVVVAIIAILASLLLPGLRGAMESARSISCRSVLSQIGVSMQLYLDDGDGCIPTAEVCNNRGPLWVDRLHPYGMDGRDAFVCPSDRKPMTSPFTRVEWGGAGTVIRHSYNYAGRLCASWYYWGWDHEGMFRAPPAYPNRADWLRGFARELRNPAGKAYAFDGDLSTGYFHDSSNNRYGPGRTFSNGWALGPYGEDLFVPDVGWVWAWRHGRRVNAGFLDGHVSSEGCPFPRALIVETADVVK
jgi:prepilin-type N-terminal cleavage/methylation domain-containing protein/prepilin-type processing-associated H-X9-DG protein